MANLGFLLAAFIIVWLVLFGYLWFVASRQARLNREIAVLRDEVSRDRSA